MLRETMLQEDCAAENQLLSIYMQSTGSKVQFFDSGFHSPDDDLLSVERHICANCSLGNNRDSKSRNGNCGCREMHINAMRESADHGRPVVYQCKLSLVFWVSPIYRDNSFYGALRGSGFLADAPGAAKSGRTARKSAEQKARLAACNGAVSAEEFDSRICLYPHAGMEKINSLAELLLLCAKAFSSRGNHRFLRLRSEQHESLSSLVNELKEKYPAGTEFPPYPLAKERQLVTSISRGNTAAAKKLLNEIFAVLVFNSKDQFRYIQLKSLELAALLSRSEADSVGGFTAEYNVSCFKHIQEAKTAEDLSCILHNLLEDITGRINSFLGIPHASAMRKAELYIRDNLRRKMSLNEIASVAGLSAPYFSSIFKNEMGENLSVYINRLRVEKASKLLRETTMSLSEISGECCFEDQSWFSRIFKAYTGISPGKFRSQAVDHRCTGLA